MIDRRRVSFSILLHAKKLRQAPENPLDATNRDSSQRTFRSIENPPVRIHSNTGTVRNSLGCAWFSGNLLPSTETFVQLEIERMMCDCLRLRSCALCKVYVPLAAVLFTDFISFIEDDE